MLLRHGLQTSLGSRIATTSTRTCITRNLATRDILERSPKPTAAPPRLNIYKDIWPPLLTCTGIALFVFYGLEYWRLQLASKYRLQDMAIEIEALKAQVEQLRTENEEKTRSLTSKLSRKGAAGTSEGRSKWFGIF